MNWERKTKININVGIIFFVTFMLYSWLVLGNFEWAVIFGILALLSK